MKLSSETYLTFDDVLIKPNYSDIASRSLCKQVTMFTKRYKLQSPIISSPMDTVTELDMAYAMWQHGGVGIVHRFMTIDAQVGIIRKLKENLLMERQYSERHGRAFDDSEWYSNPPICAAVGATKDYVERAMELVRVGVNVILIDTAHGHRLDVKNAIRRLKKFLPEHVDIIAGNVATRDGAVELVSWGADAIRVGIGGGSLCSTRIKTGVGIPQITAILECNNTYVPTIADGGIRMVGDVAKAIAAGANTVMLGSILAGTKETPGRVMRTGKWPNEQLFKKYQGSASLESKIQRGEQETNVEGESKLIPYKGKVCRLLDNISDGLKSSMSYVGVDTIDEFRRKAELIRITPASHMEGLPHLLIGEK